MNQRTSLLLALCAALQVIGTTQSASAVSILFRLDNLPNPSNAVPYTTTDNNICVHVKYNGSNWIPVGCKQLTTASNAHDYCLSGVSLWLMEEVKISTDGSNALWLDKWQAFSFASSDCTGSSTLQDSRGIDNDVGYCISTQSSDYGNPECTIFGTDGHVGSGPSYSQLWWPWDCPAGECP